MVHHDYVKVIAGRFCTQTNQRHSIFVNVLGCGLVRLYTSLRKLNHMYNIALTCHDEAA